MSDPTPTNAAPAPAPVAAAPAVAKPAISPMKARLLQHVVRNIRTDADQYAKSVSRRIFQNGHRFTADEVKAALGPQSDIVLAHVATARALAAGLSAVPAAQPAAPATGTSGT
jgi:predicted phosphatase